MISLIGAGITIAANLVLVPFFGYTGSAWATFICYFSMMVICYLMGVKYYPIAYHIKKLTAYTAFALLLFFAGEAVRKYAPGTVLMYALNTILFLFFAGVAFWFERKNKILTSPN